MLLFFTSNLQKRYQNDAWLALAYPRGHIIRFRYHDRIVDPKILKWHSGEDGSIDVPYSIRDGTIVFADHVAGNFNFYPLRKAYLVRMWKRGLAYYVALRLEEYVDYGTGDRLKIFRDSLGQLEDIPRVQRTDQKNYGEGRFLYLTFLAFFGARTSHSSDVDADDRWHKIITTLANSPNARDTLFYRVRGIYRLSSKIWPEEFSATETLVEPTTLYAESCYRLWMGRNYILKILFYIPGVFRQAPDVEISASHKEGAVVTPETLQILSRYNEERILIGCRRVLDRTLNPIWIKHANDKEDPSAKGADQIEVPESQQQEISATAASDKYQLSGKANNDPEYPDLRIVEGYLLTQVEAPPGMIAGLVVVLAIASVFIAMGPDMVSGLWRVTGYKIEDKDATLVAALFKTLGAILSLVAGYFAFRRLPTGK
jgi:hypothetical protein